MDSASSSASSSPAPGRPALFKHTPSTPLQRYKQEQQLLRERAMAGKAAAAAERLRRDRMARGKDPYDSAEDEFGEEDEQLPSNSRSPHARHRLGGATEPENYAQKERREKAIAFLDNPELLMMYAQAKGDSITGSRLHFMKMMCGYDEETLADKEAQSRRTTSTAARRSTAWQSRTADTH